MEEKLALESPGTGAVQALLNVTEGGDDREGWQRKMAQDEVSGIAGVSHSQPRACLHFCTKGEGRGSHEVCLGS